MSVDIYWETLTGGRKGNELAEKIRTFVHDKFQEISLPRFISSVKVHSFDFGDTPPSVEIKDICDPLAEFYEDEDDDENEEENTTLLNNDQAGKKQTRDHSMLADRNVAHLHNHQIPAGVESHAAKLSAGGPRLAGNPQLKSHSNVPESSTPLSPLFLQHAGSSNAPYFHLPYGAGLSGRSTPLAAVASGQYHGGWPDILQTTQQPTAQQNTTEHLSPKLGHGRENSESVSSSIGISSSEPASSRPQSQHLDNPSTKSGFSIHDFAAKEQRPSLEDIASDQQTQPVKDPNDLQIVAHVRYSGNMSLVMTAEILVDYPMPSFVGIPLQLHITGFSFDGVAILAYTDKKLHFCFLSPEDADMFLGAPQKEPKSEDVDTAASRQSEDQPQPDHHSGHRNSAERRSGSLLEEVRVDSEIGDKMDGKQVLKNVGKVEKFVLEQVQKIFEDEFVFPSFWTVLV